MSNFIKMAWRNIGRNSRRSMITILTVVIGIFVLVCLRSFLNGFQAEIIDTGTNKMVGDIQIHHHDYKNNVSQQPFDYFIPYDSEMIQKIRNTEGVIHSGGSITTFGMVNNQRTQETAMTAIIGLDSLDNHKVCHGFIEGIREGSMFDSSKERFPKNNDDPTATIETVANLDEIGEIDSTITEPSNRPDDIKINENQAQSQERDEGYHQILLTPALKEGLKAELGDEMVILLQDKYNMQQAVVCEFVGVVDISLPGRGVSKQVWIDLATAQQLLSAKDEVETIIIKTDKRYAVDQVKTNLESVLPNDQYIVERWDQILGQMADMMIFQNIISTIVIVFMLTLVAFALVNTSLMTVMERVREIGTLMALGYKRKNIMLIFLLEAIIMGLIGGTIAMILGLSAVFVVQSFGILFVIGESSLMIYPQITGWFVIMVFGITLVVSLVSSFYPAYRASRMKPVEALASI